MGNKINNLPPQQLPFTRKTKAWRKKHLDWAEGRTFFNYDLVRKSTIHKKINYDLLLGKLHMEDLHTIVNPDNIDASFVNEQIQHYPIMNSKLNVLRGEESKRIFDYRVIVTNPNSISEVENAKKQEILGRLQQLVADPEMSEEQYLAEIEKLNKYMLYEWQDFREIRANALLTHYSKEYNMPLIFNEGYMDAMTVGEEIYQCDIVGGEPTIERLDPIKITAFQSGYSNKLEDADIIILEDYWSPSKIIDTYYDVLTAKDREYIENFPDYVGGAHVDSMGNIDDRAGFVSTTMIDDTITSRDGFFFSPGETGGVANSLLPYDLSGNIRVIRMYWKSRRKIKKVKSYDPMTGEELFNFYPETYVLNEDLGEEEQVFYINEAWEGTKIGESIYVNMRPRPVQYNRLSNPSRCHFGIVGSVYNLNNNKPFSMVDMMKPYNYYYDAVHDRVNKLLARNWGKIIQLDLAKVPTGWDIEKWMYYAKINNIAVVDSFKEGNIGAATGKLAGALNNASSGIIDAELGATIQYNISLLNYIKEEMSEVAGISRQREGQISNRETVGGVERATLQSSHITEWLFVVHDDVKKRALECFLETAKIALRGRKKKFQHILSDHSSVIMEIDGDEFAESDYGLVVTNDPNIQNLSSKLDTLAQAALQNQALSFSTIMKLYGSSSLAEKQRFIERDEQQLMERQQQAQQQALQAQQQQAQSQAMMKQLEIEKQEEANIRDNETKVLIATINAEAAANRDLNNNSSGLDQEELQEKIREFDAKMKLDTDKFEYSKKKDAEELRLKEKQITSRNVAKSDNKRKD